MESINPQVEIHIIEPNFELITPQALSSSNPEIIFSRGGVRVARVSPTIVVKYGDDVHLIEATTLEFLASHTSILVPRVYAAYTYGPFEDRDEESSSKYDTYIFMDFIDGQTLDKEWSNLDDAAKSQVMAELKGYLVQLRAIPGGTYIGSLDDGPVNDSILEYWPTKGIDSSPTSFQRQSDIDSGPFASEDDLNNALIDAYCASYKGEVRPFMTGMLNTHKHEVVFTHADFRPTNIILKNGHVVGIIDWEMAGWYPEHWEFVKAFYVWRWQNDWGTRLLGVLQPYYCEQAVHARMTAVLI
ncbi:kinase-like protein [Venturia nashicola]|uniref:Kinase-like protein n=1 Tax=Venturia nashicola TaxID=86259 RepID=A0A4Z1NXB2_9PEZI|nr:kinase-like protein [Venturia nashicola]TLD29931.1 kinase-like protein [Venturia nashicola]